MRMEVGEKKEEAMEVDSEGNCSKSTQLIHLLRRFLGIQQRRAEAYAKLKRGFDEYMMSGVELNYKQLCGEVTVEFNSCSKEVLEMASLLVKPEFCRDDLAGLLRSVQEQEKQKLHLCFSFSFLASVSYRSYVLHPPHHLSNPFQSQVSLTSNYRFLNKTARIQILKKAGHPSERLVSHENCRLTGATKHECVHVNEITEAMGTEEAEADAEYVGALNEAIRGVQDAVTNINEHLEEVRYEIEALEAEEQ